MEKETIKEVLSEILTDTRASKAHIAQASAQQSAATNADSSSSEDGSSVVEASGVRTSIRQVDLGGLVTGHFASVSVAVNMGINGCLI